MESSSRENSQSKIYMFCVCYCIVSTCEFFSIGAIDNNLTILLCVLSINKQTNQTNKQKQMKIYLVLTCRKTLINQLFGYSITFHRVHSCLLTLDTN